VPACRQLLGFVPGERAHHVWLGITPNCLSFPFPAAPASGKTIEVPFGGTLALDLFAVSPRGQVNSRGIESACIPGDFVLPRLAAITDVTCTIEGGRPD
jgi:hypothetical protein